MMSRHLYKVREVSQLTGVSIRTLHHYDQIGLLVPKARSEAGYRLYDGGDILRLQQILLARELGLSLKEIRAALDDPNFDQRSSLLAHKRRLQDRLKHVQSMLSSVDAALAHLEQDNAEGFEKMSDLFQGFDPQKYEEEAAEKWGDGESYRIANQRTKNYSPAQWKTIREAQSAIYLALYAAKSAGEAPDGQKAMDLAERHRLLIAEYFYPCDHEMHNNLAMTYESDARFAKNIDKAGDGTAAFLAEAIRANGRR